MRKSGYNLTYKLHTKLANFKEKAASLSAVLARAGNTRVNDRERAAIAAQQGNTADRSPQPVRIVPRASIRRHQAWPHVLTVRRGDMLSLRALTRRATVPSALRGRSRTQAHSPARASVRRAPQESTRAAPPSTRAAIVMLVSTLAHQDRRFVLSAALANGRHQRLWRPAMHARAADTNRRRAQQLA